MTGKGKAGKIYVSLPEKRIQPSPSISGDRKKAIRDRVALTKGKPKDEVTDEEIRQWTLMFFYTTLDFFFPHVKEDPSGDYGFEEEQAYVLELLHTHRDRLSEVEKGLVEDHLGLGEKLQVTLAEAGRKYGMSRQRAGQIWDEVMKKLRQPVEEKPSEELPMSHPTKSFGELKRYATQLKDKADLASQEEKVAEKILDLLEHGHNVESVLDILKRQKTKDLLDEEDVTALAAAIRFIEG